MTTDLPFTLVYLWFHPSCSGMTRILCRLRLGLQFGRKSGGHVWDTKRRCRNYYDGDAILCWRVFLICQGESSHVTPYSHHCHTITASKCSPFGSGEILPDQSHSLDQYAALKPSKDVYNLINEIRRSKAVKPQILCTDMFHHMISSLF